MRRLLVFVSLALGQCLASASLAGADEVEPLDPVANVRVTAIDVQLFPVLVIGMEVPVVTVTVQNTGAVPTPAFSLDTRVSYYGTSASHAEAFTVPALAPGATRTLSFQLRPQIVGVREPHGITSVATPFPGELERTDNRLFEILEF